MAGSEDLLIVGSLAFDSVQTPMGKVDRALGGSASYAAIAASYFARPQVVGIVGEDFGDTHMKKFTSHGIDVAGIERVPGQTFHWSGRYHENFKERDTLVTELNVFEHFDPVLPESYRNSRYVFLANIAPALQLRVLEQATAAEFVAMDTMNLWIDIAREELREVFKRVDMVFINDEEAVQFTEEDSIIGAAEKILELGPKYAVVKRGEYGALLFGEGFTLFVPAVLLRNVVDPTGAGDTFAGGFLGYMTGFPDRDRGSMLGALSAGTTLASFSVEAFSVDGICQLPGDKIEQRRLELESMIR